MDGVEAEATALLPFNLRLDGNITVQESKVDSHQQLFDPAVAEAIDIANGGPFNGDDVNQRFAAFSSAKGDIYGHELPKVPPFTGNIALQDRLDLSNGATLTSSIHFIYRSSYFFRIYNSPTTDGCRRNARPTERHLQVGERALARRLPDHQPDRQRFRQFALHGQLRHLHHRQLLCAATPVHREDRLRLLKHDPAGDPRSPGVVRLVIHAGLPSGMDDDGLFVGLRECAMSHDGVGIGDSARSA